MTLTLNMAGRSETPIFPGDGYLVLDSQGRVLDANQEYVRLSGHGALGEILGRSVSEWTAEGAKQRNTEALALCAKDGFLRNFVTEYVDGRGRVTFVQLNATVERMSGVLRILTSCHDVTEQTRREKAIRQLTRRLISAREEERSHFARELHDNIGQRIALLSTELGSWKQEVPDSAVDIHAHIHRVRQGLSELADEIRALSHGLHSSTLKYLGIVTAADCFCKELSEKQQVQVEFIHSDIPNSVPDNISLCLFRVLQEALQNAVKHSGGRHVTVELRGAPEEIQLTVSDSGTGFEPEEAMHGPGLGLISMRERLGLVDGELSVSSARGNGTTIHARVPSSKSRNSLQVAGQGR